MIQLLDSGLELWMKSGFVYVPLLLDADIAREIQDRFARERPSQPATPEQPKSLVEFGGRPFISSIHIQSVAANFQDIDRDYYESLVKDHVLSYPPPPDFTAISAAGKLRTIVLRIMPYFIRKSRGLERRPLDDDELLDFIAGKIDIPRRFMEQAERFVDPGPLRQHLTELDRVAVAPEPPGDGPTNGEVLRRWLDRALRAQIASRERTGLEQELRVRERIGPSQRNHVAVLLYLAEEGSFELDGFGFSRIGTRDDYLIYKRTGEYVLKDYYGRGYRFPDCRVAVSTTASLRPIVIESYKHPFLLGHAPRQEICISGYHWPDRFTADNIIRLLEEGINTLLYGYDPRRRNGYHSLDRTLYYVKTIEFDDYRV